MEKAKKEAYCRTDRYGRNVARVRAARDGSHFHAADLDWEHPDYEVKLDDKRWILDPRVHPIANHEWHDNLSEEEKIIFGIQMIGHTSLLGAQFELGLNAGIMAHGMNLSTTKFGTQKAETRWSDNSMMLDEAGEEVQHIHLFEGMNEKMQRALMQHPDKKLTTTSGAPKWLRKSMIPLLTTLGNSQPVGLWTGVYTGEAPIDFVQRNMKDLHEDEDSGVELPTLLYDIIKLHHVEESRHIGFAKDYLLDHTGKDADGKDRMTPAKQKLFAATFAGTLTVAGKLMAYPDKDARRIMNLPDKVAKQTWEMKETKEFLDKMYADPRELAFKMGMFDTAVGRAAWKAAGLYNAAHIEELRDKAASR